MNVQRILDEKIKNYTQNNGQKLVDRHCEIIQR